MNKHQIKGKIKEAKGQIEVGIGKMVGSKKTIARGHADKVAGQLQEKAGDVKQKFDKKYR